MFSKTFLYVSSSYLPGSLPISAELTRDFHRSPVRYGGAGHLIRVADPDWPLQVVSGARSFREDARRRALHLSRDVVSLFVDAPPMATRARALTNAFDRVLADREVTRMHTAADYETIAQFWRTAALSDDERLVLPEVAGAASALYYSLSTLRDTHAKLVAYAQDYATRNGPTLDSHDRAERQKVIRALAMAGPDGILH